MKRVCMTVIATLLAPSAQAENIGVSIASFDDTFLTSVRAGMEQRAKELDGVTLQMEDGFNDVARQFDQIGNFIASSVEAMIVVSSNTDVTPRMSKMAKDAGIPLVYVNRQPADLQSLPQNVGFIASNETDSGVFQMTEMCRLMNGVGNVVLLQGDVTNYAARQRTLDVYNVISKEPCKGIKIVTSGVANWSRDQAYTLVSSWIAEGVKFSGIVANNDEMALGAIKAVRDAGIDPKTLVIGGIDATAGALEAMQAGDLDITVFQDAAAQGAGAVDLARRLASGGSGERIVWVPFELVTPANARDFLGRNR